MIMNSDGNIWKTSEYEYIVVDGMLKRWNGYGNCLFVPEGVTVFGPDCLFYAQRALLDVVEIHLPYSFQSFGENVDALKFLANVKTVVIHGSPSTDFLHRLHHSLPDTKLVFTETSDYRIFSGVIIKKDTFSIVLVPAGTEGHVALPQGTTEIPDNAFENLPRLLSAAIPVSVAKIGKYAFYKCSSLASIDIPNESCCLAEGVFADCELLQTVKLPRNIQIVPKGLYSRCSSLQAVDIPHGVRQIGSWAFHLCRELKAATLPLRLTSVSSHAFTSCAFPEIILPDSVQEIGKMAFHSCMSAARLVIGEGVRSIGYQAFGFCWNLSTVVYNATEVADLPKDKASVFIELGNKTEGTSFRFGDSVKYIPAHLLSFEDFYNSTQKGKDFALPKIKELFLGKNIQSIGENALIGIQPKVVYVAHNTYAEHYAKLCWPDRVTVL